MRVHVCAYMSVFVCVWTCSCECACMCVCICVSVCMHMCILCISGSGTCVLFTCDFSESGVLADLMIALLFFWQTQHRSDKGFIMVMCGVSCLHSEQIVVYAAALSPVSSQASL